MEAVQKNCITSNVKFPLQILIVMDRLACTLPHSSFCIFCVCTNIWLGLFWSVGIVFVSNKNGDCIRLFLSFLFPLAICLGDPFNDYSAFHCKDQNFLHCWLENGIFQKYSIYSRGRMERK